VLDSLYIFVSIFKQLPQEGAKKEGGKRSKFLGRFFIDWRQGLPKDVWLTYDYEHDSLGFEVRRYPINDETIMEAGVYSLVEFFPGVIGASPNVGDDFLCDRRNLGKEACMKEVDAAYKGLSLRELTLGFPYPKQIRLSEGQATPCTSEGRQLLLLNLPTDIEAIDSLGNIENFKPDSSPQQTCVELGPDGRG
jgi:hypothetical protein